jgi:hypothetical protein
MWVSHLDQNVVDTVNMDVLNLSSFHVIKDSTITQGSV